MNLRYRKTIDSPLGPLTLESTDIALVALIFGTSKLELKGHPLLNLAAFEINQYFARTRQSFTIPMQIDGSDFEVKVWRYLQGIPYGSLRTYSQVAKAVGHHGASRAVGNALGKNRLPILLPCHRIISMHNKLGGFGAGLSIKKSLLALEGNDLSLFTG